MKKSASLMVHVEVEWPDGYPASVFQRYGHAVAYNAVHETYDVVLLDGTLQEGIPGRYVREIDFAEQAAMPTAVSGD